MKPSICKWTLTFQFKDKEQIKNFIDELMYEHVDFSFEFSPVMTETSIIYEMTVSCSWAKNLSTVAAILEKVDYKDE